MESDRDIFDAVNGRDEALAIRLLKQNPALAAKENRLGQSIFWLASSYGMTTLVRLLLEPPYRDYFSPYDVDAGGRTAIDIANGYGFDETAAILGEALGVGKYSYKEEAKRHKRRVGAMVDALFGAIEGITNSIKNTPKAGIAAIAASVAVVAALMLVFTADPIPKETDDGFDPERIIASGNGISVEEMVTEALESSSNAFPLEKIRSLATDLGYEVGIENRRHTEQPTGATNIRCEITQKNTTQAENTYIIEVRDIGSRDIDILTNFNLSDFENNKELTLIIAYSIKFCF